MLDTSLTKGKNKVRIKIEVGDHGKPFMAYEYKMYSL